MSDRPDPAARHAAQDLLQASGIAPRKRWGQNFLCDHNMLEKIADTARLAPDDAVLEIGPGLGALTRPLAARCARVTAVEIDTGLGPALEATLGDLAHVRVVFADFLALETGALLEDAFGAASGVVVANIPYNISTPILERLLLVRGRWKRAVLLVQQEFAQRLTAQPGCKEYGSLTVFMRLQATVTIAGRVPPQVFWPIPEVSSNIVVIEPKPSEPAPVASMVAFELALRAGFAQRRKTLLNGLQAAVPALDREAAGTLLAAANIEGLRRGETLSLEEFVRLADGLAGIGAA